MNSPAMAATGGTPSGDVKERRKASLMISLVVVLSAAARASIAARNSGSTLLKTYHGYVAEPRVTLSRLESHNQIGC